MEGAGYRTLSFKLAHELPRMRTEGNFRYQVLTLV